MPTSPERVAERFVAATHPSRVAAQFEPLVEFFKKARIKRNLQDCHDDLKELLESYDDLSDDVQSIPVELDNLADQLVRAVLDHKAEVSEVLAKGFDEVYVRTLKGFVEAIDDVDRYLRSTPLKELREYERYRWLGAVRNAHNWYFAVLSDGIEFLEYKRDNWDGGPDELRELLLRLIILTEDFVELR